MATIEAIRIRQAAVLALGIAWAARALAGDAPATAPVPIAVPAPGAELYSPSRACYAKVLEEPPGRTLRARLYRRGELAGEVSGTREMAWVDEALVFAAGPDSGRPGIYVWDCAHATLRRVVRPLRSDLAHPGGTDLYRLLEVDGDVLYYAHAPDGDSPTLERDLERGIETLRLAPPKPRISMR